MSENAFKIDKTNDTSGGGVFFTKGGLHIVKLAKVEVEESTTQKGSFLTLNFTVTDLEGIKSHVDKLFAPKDDDKFNDNITRIGNHVKHIWEQFLPTPEQGIVNGAADTKDFFNKIAAAFNTGKNGQPIYQEKHGLWWKLVFNNGGRYLSTPLFPIFCERIGEKNAKEPKTVQILSRDIIELPKSPSAPTGFSVGSSEGIDVPF